MPLILHAVNSKDTNNNTLFHSWSFGKVNYILSGIGLIVILLAYILMATGETESIQSIKLSPIILIIGYCILIPMGILIKPKDKP